MTDQTNWIEIKPEGETSNFDPKWDYQKQKILIGVLTEVKKDVGKHHSTVYTIEQQDNGKVTVWGSTVLDDRIKDIVIGEEIKIEYLGDKPTDKGNPYHDFTVFKKG
jgi:hypothetical protein